MNADLARSFQMLIENKEFVFKFIDMFPIPRMTTSKIFTMRELDI